MSKDEFFPAGYETPVDVSSFMKMKDEGEYTIRILSSAVVGYEYFTTENKPKRSKTPFTEPLLDIKIDEKTGKETTPKHFWVFLVYNYALKAVQSLEITQKTLMNQIKAYVDNPKWGNPTGYDLKITKVGQKLLTKYTVQAEPHTPITPEIAEMAKNSDIDLEMIFEE